jgi:hypothetical protein
VIAIFEKIWVIEDQKKVMVMVMVEENQDEHYFVAVFIHLGYSVQLNVDCIHQGLEKKAFERDRITITLVLSYLVM